MSTVPIIIMKMLLLNKKIDIKHESLKMSWLIKLCNKICLCFVLLYADKLCCFFISLVLYSLVPSLVARGSSWDSGSPHRMNHKGQDTPEAGYQPYRNCDPDMSPVGYQPNYRLLLHPIKIKICFYSEM